MRVEALQQYEHHPAGDVFEVSASVGRRLEAFGIVRPYVEPKAISEPPRDKSIKPTSTRKKRGRPKKVNDGE